MAKPWQSPSFCDRFLAITQTFDFLWSAGARFPGVDEVVRSLLPPPFALYRLGGGFRGSGWGVLKEWGKGFPGVARSWSDVKGAGWGVWETADFHPES